MNVGYLIIYNDSDSLLEITPKLHAEGKYVFIVTVDIRENKPTPSSKNEKVATITEIDILDSLTN